MYWELPSERSRLVRSSMYFCCTCMAAVALEMLGSDTEPLAACPISGTVADKEVVEEAATEALPITMEEDSDILSGRKHSFCPHSLFLNSNPRSSAIRGKLDHELWLLDDRQKPFLSISSLDDSLRWPSSRLRWLHIFGGPIR